jgi:hypothetical protein
MHRAKRVTKEKPKMKRTLSMMLVAVFAVLAVASAAMAEEIKMVGVITNIVISGPDAKTATATLKDNKTGEPLTVIVNDELTLDKFKDHRIVVGDEIRCKHEVIDGRNVSKYFRKTAGC